MRNFFSTIQFFFSPRLKTEGKENLQQLKHVLTHGGIEFSFKKVTEEDGTYVIAQSLNASGKHIVTSGRDIAELDRNIKDAIFTAFQVPAQYCDDSLISSPLIPEQEVTLKYATEELSKSIARQWIGLGMM